MLSAALPDSAPMPGIMDQLELKHKPWVWPIIFVQVELDSHELKALYLAVCRVHIDHSSLSKVDGKLLLLLGQSEEFVLSMLHIVRIVDLLRPKDVLLVHSIPLQLSEEFDLVDPVDSLSVGENLLSLSNKLLSTFFDYEAEPSTSHVASPELLDNDNSLEEGSFSIASLDVLQDRSAHQRMMLYFPEVLRILVGVNSLDIMVDVVFLRLVVGISSRRLVVWRQVNDLSLLIGSWLSLDHESVGVDD